MRLGDEDPSANFEDRTGQSGFGFGGGGGNMLGCLLPLIASRFGLGGVVILVIGYFLLGSLGNIGGTGDLVPAGGQGAPAGQSTLDPATRDVVLRVLGSTERRWTDLFAAAGGRYAPARLVFYRGGTQSGCGGAQSAMGPFYCPTDGRIYLDTAFFSELSRRFGAPGDFAMAYVIAHEVGHRVQDQQGALEQTQQLQARASETQANALQVKIELQADCYAGVWAARDQNLMEPGDLEEGLRAAGAIGDDALQRQTQGAVVPESFTHGTSAQRVAALRRGYQGGDPAACRL